jgi:hypothetical protein
MPRNLNKILRLWIRLQEVYRGKIMFLRVETKREKAPWKVLEQKQNVNFLQAHPQTKQGKKWST